MVEEARSLGVVLPPPPPPHPWAFCPHPCGVDWFGGRICLRGSGSPPVVEYVRGGRPSLTSAYARAAR